jgi:hypothetical protein
VAVLVWAALHRVLGGASPWPALLAVTLIPLLPLAAHRACAVEITPDGVVRRGLLGCTMIAWSDVRAIRFHRFGGVERLRVHARLSHIDVSSDRPGFDAAAHSLRAHAAFRSIPIVAA